jgi:hypothetical protein
VTNADWILTKNAIIRKVKELLASLQEIQSHHLKLHKSKLPEIVLKPNPKISKGENYKGLPYLILDNPRYFSKDNIFAIRTMFWWGNFFSITLHVSGIYKKKLAQKILASNKANSQFHYCINNSEWEHDFEKSNYLPLREMKNEDLQKYIGKQSFIKIAARVSLNEWETAGEQLMNYFVELITLEGD